MEIHSKFVPEQMVIVDLGEDGYFKAKIEGVAYNKGRIFYCVKAGGICLYTIDENVIKELKMPCRKCNGTGHEIDSYEIPCEFCDGTGTI